MPSAISETSQGSMARMRRTHLRQGLQHRRRDGGANNAVCRRWVRLRYGLQPCDIGSATARQNDPSIPFPATHRQHTEGENGSLHYLGRLPALPRGAKQSH